MRNTILGTLLLIFCASCQKSDPVLTADTGLPYIKMGFSPTPTIRVFSSAGEVRSSDISNKFANLDTFYAYDIANSMSKNPSGFLDSILFESSTKAVVSNYSNRSSYTVRQKDGGLELTSVDTLTGFVSGTEMSRNVAYFLPSPKLVFYSEELTGVSQGYYYFNYRFQDRFAIRSGGGQALDVPFLLYSWYKGNALAGRDFVKGSLDPGFYLHVPQGDTVTIREYTSHYKK